MYRPTPSATPANITRARTSDFLQASCAALPCADASVDLRRRLRGHRAPRRTGASSWPSSAACSAPARQSWSSRRRTRHYYAESRGASGPNPYHVHEFEFEEFSDELRRLFPHVNFFLQNHVAAIGFQPLDPAGSAGIDSRSAECLAQAADAHFYVAVCSGDPLPPAPTFLYVPSTANILREREIHIDKLQDEVQELRAEKQKLIDMFRAQTAELDRSNAWAQELDGKLHAAQDRIVQLQQELDQTTKWATRPTGPIGSQGQGTGGMRPVARHRGKHGPGAHGVGATSRFRTQGTARAVEHHQGVPLVEARAHRGPRPGAAERLRCRS